MPTTPEEKVFQDVQLHVDFTQASTRSNISTYDPTAAEPENISTAFGKLSKWYEALVPTGGSDGQFLGWNSDGTAKWVNNPNADTKVTQQSTSSQKYRAILFGYTEATDPSGLTSTVTNKAFVTSKFYVKPSTGQMFIDGSLQISNSSYGPLTIKRTTTANAGIRFENSNGFLGSLGIGTVDGVFKRYLSDNSTYYTILDTGNTSVTTTGSGNAITSLSFSNGVFTADKGSTFLTQHPTITLSADTTSTPPQLSHGGTFTAITSVTREENGHVTKINTATYTLPNDTSMTQTNTTDSADYRVLLSGNANDTTETTTGRKSTNLKFNPSTGVLSASSGVTTKTITRSALKGMLTGSGTAAQDKGSGVSPRYFPAKWTFNTGLTAANGDVFIIKLPTAGHSYGVFLSIDNGANYYPISVNGTSRLTTHYGNGYSIAVMFKSDGSTADVFPLAGGDSRSTVTGGCWQVLNYYDSGNTNTKVNVTLGTTTKAYLLGTSTTPTSSAQAVTSIADTGVYLGTTAGSLYATTFYGSLSGTATSANKLNTDAGATNRPVYFSSGVPVQCDAPESGSWFKGVPLIGTNGVMEIGKYIDFHKSNDSTADYDLRLQYTGTATGNTITFPGASGTVALLTKGSTSYWGIIDGDGATSGWIRTTTNGFIPATEVSLANGGDGSLGTSMWAFKNAYIANINGVAVGSTPKFTDANVTQSATATEDFRPILMGATHVSGSSTGLDATVTGEAYVSTKLFCQPSTGNLYVTGDIKRANNTLSLWSGNDCAGVSQRNNYDINTWYGFSVSNACTTTGTLNKVAFSVNARNGQAWHTGNVHLYSASGDSPALVFQRGTFVDDLNDWKIYVSGGELRFAQSTANASSETWTTKMCFHASDGNLYVGSTKVSLNGHTHNYAGSASAGGPALSVSTAGGDVVLGTPGSSSDDSGDIVWKYGNGQEKARLWQDNTYTAKAGPQYRIYKSDGTGLYSGRLPLADGTSASGTWEISITGNAATATTATNVAIARVTKDSKVFPGANKVVFEEYTNGTTYNLPSNHFYHIMSVQGSDTRYGTQLALGMTTAAAYYRVCNNQEWSGWKSLINTDTTYSANNGVGLSGTTFYNSGVRAVSTGSANGTISVNTNGTSGDVAVKGLASAAYVTQESLLRARSSVTTDGGATGWSQIGINQYNNAYPDGVTNKIYSYGAVVSMPAPNARFDLYYNHNSSTAGAIINGLQYRTGWDNDKKAWRMLLDNDNYGSYMTYTSNRSGYASSDTHILQLGYFVTDGLYDNCTILVSSAFWGNQHGSSDIINFQQSNNTDTTSTAIHVTMSRIRIGGSVGRTFYYKADNTNNRVYLYVYVTGGNSYGRWNTTVLQSSGLTTYWRPSMSENQASSDLTEIPYTGRVDYATTATASYVLGRNTAAGLTTTGVQYAVGQLTIGSADGNAKEGSNASYKLWSYPTGGTVVSSTSANIQNLRLYWSSAYYRDIFISPNNYDIYHRAVENNNAQAWRKILDSGNYTSYALPRNIKHIHTASGTEGSAGWVKIARITVTAAYANHPMTFTIAQRGIMQYRIHLVLVNNGSVATAAISEFIIARDNSWEDTNNPRAYIIKPSDGIFDLYIRKTENYDHIFVVDFTKADGSEGDNYSVDWTNVHAADSAITGGTEADKKSYTKVNVTLATTTKAYLLATSTTPTSSAQAVTSVSDTGVYLGTEAGSLYATDYHTSGGARGYFLVDKASNSYGGVYDNGSNLWIGAVQSADYHHKGSTYISTGWDGTLPTAAGTFLTGNTTIIIGVPKYAVDSNGKGHWDYTGYAAIHAGNYTSYTVTKTGGGASGTWGISITGSAASIATEVGTTAGARPVFYAYLGDNTRVVYNTNFTYNPSGNVLTAGTISASAGVNANTANNSTAGGLSLYSTNPDNYGIIFRGTSQKGKHGYVTSDWATYFTMNNDNSRGWIFHKQSNVASISGGGNAVFNGSVTVGGNATNTSGCRLTYNSSTQSLDFIFA